jgi:hypothetical protein
MSHKEEPELKLPPAAEEIEMKILSHRCVFLGEDKAHLVREQANERRVA